MVNEQPHTDDSDSEQLLLKTMDLLEEAVLVTDVHQRILLVNAAFTCRTGYSNEDLIGKTPSVLRFGQREPSFYQAMWKSLHSEGIWHGEFLNRRKNGETYLDRVVISALKNPMGEVTHFIAKFIGASLHKQQENPHRMAMYDELTDLPNRRLLQNHLTQAMVRSHHHEKVMAICMLDLDGFKPVNDKHGHEAGDHVLVTLGKRISEHLRKTDLVARLGGDEFVLLIEELCGISDLVPILEKIHAAITAPINLNNGETVQVGTSMGIYLYPFGDAEISDQLLRCADHALYESKLHKHDRDRFWFLFGEKPHNLTA